MEQDEKERHLKRTQRHKAVVDEKIAKAQEDRGVIVINTGNGKGKSSSAFGMAIRALGHDMRVGIVQFIKGAYSTGEETFLRRIPEVEFYVMGEGFTWETQDKERDIQAAQRAWEKSKEFLSSSEYKLVVLDEINIALKLRYIAVDDVIAALRRRPREQHVVLTGRAAPPELIAIADTVTDMRVVKHAFDAGIMAQKGVEL